MKNKPTRPPEARGCPLDDAKLPHDRDEAAERVRDDGLRETNREPIEQARRDVESGIRDTERVGTPNDVPTKPAPKRPVR